MIKNKKSFILVFVLGLFFLICGLAFASDHEVNLSLTVRPADVIDEDDDDDEPSTSNSGGGVIIVRPPKTQPEETEGAEEENEEGENIPGEPVEEPGEEEAGEEGEELVEEPKTPEEVKGILENEDNFEVDEDDESGIKVYYPVEENRDKLPKSLRDLKYVLVLPDFPLLKRVKDFFVPRLTQLKEAVPEEFPQNYVFFEGKVDTPNAYLLLEILSIPRTVVLRADKEGKWSFKPPYKLDKGEHKSFLWVFPSTSSGVNRSYLYGSKSFVVGDDTPEDQKIVLKSQEFEVTPDKSVLRGALEGSAGGENFFYFGGRVINDLDAVRPGGELEIVIVLTPILENMMTDLELEFSFDLYDANGVLVESIKPGKKYGFENNILSFVKNFDISDKSPHGEYSIIAKTSIPGSNLAYELPLNFIIKDLPNTTTFATSTKNYIFIVLAAILATFASHIIKPKKKRHV